MEYGIIDKVMQPNDAVAVSALSMRRLGGLQSFGSSFLCTGTQHRKAIGRANVQGRGTSNHVLTPAPAGGESYMLC